MAASYHYCSGPGRGPDKAASSLRGSDLAQIATRQLVCNYCHNHEPYDSCFEFQIREYFWIIHENMFHKTQSLKESLAANTWT